MAQKPMLRAEVYAYAMRASQNRKKDRTTDRAGRARAPTHAHPVFDDKNSTPTHPAL